MITEKRLTDSNKYFIFLLLCSLIYFFRFYMLDSDIPFFELAEIHPGDEPYYNEIAIKICENGLSSIFSGLLNDVCVANAKTYMLPNILVGISMRLLGKNYWGLRVPYVLIGYVCFLLLIDCTKKCFPNSKYCRYILPLFYLIDFNLLMLSRAGTTVFPCILVTTIYIKGSIYLKDSDMIFLFWGVWPVISLLLFYMGLPYLFLVSLLLFLYRVIVVKNAKNVKAFVLFLAGILLGFLLCEIADFALFRQHIWQVFWDTLVVHSGKISHPPAGVIDHVKTLIYNAMRYLSSNMYKYSSVFVVIVSYSIIISIRHWFSHKDENIFLLLSIVACYWGQTIFLPNMTDSKSTITIIAILLLVGNGINLIENDLLKAKYTEQILFLSMSAMIGIISYYFLKNKVFYISQGKYYLFWFVGLILAVVTIGVRNKYLTIGLSAFYLVSMLMFSGKYVYLNNTFTYRDTCKDLNYTVGNHMVIGWPTAFGLYNDIIPAVDDYEGKYKGKEYDSEDIIQKAIEITDQHEVVYWIKYVNRDSVNIHASLDEGHEFELIKIYNQEFYRSNKVGNCDIAVYRKSK